MNDTALPLTSPHVRIRSLADEVSRLRAEVAFLRQAEAVQDQRIAALERRLTHSLETL